MTDFVESFKLVGAVAGLLAFLWAIWNSYRSYLVLGLEVLRFDGASPLLKVTVSNSGTTSKLISYAAILISPEEMRLSESVDKLYGSDRSAKDKTSIARLFREREDKRRTVADCTLIPLPELYEEQAMVGPGEVISYVCPVHPHNVTSGVFFIVRFIVFISYVGLFIRCRFTAEGLRIE